MKGHPATPSPTPRDAAKGGPGGAAAQGVKTFVLDTSVLLHNPKAIFVFQDNNIVIPFTVLAELDRFKTKNDDLGRAARECIRYLDQLRQRGHLMEGVSLGNGKPAIEAALPARPTGTLRVALELDDRHPALHEDIPDNRIISVATHLQSQGERVVFVSKDINARIKCDALGVTAEDFENQKVDLDRLYTGYLTRRVSGDVLDALYSDRMLDLARLGQSPEGAGDGGVEAAEVPEEAVPAIVSNEFVVLIDEQDDGHTGLGRRLADTEHLIPVTSQRRPTFGIMARNVQQTMALDLLLDDEVKLVTLIGSAGTGKTLLAVAAGMAKVFNEERYEKLLVARPIMPMGRDIGYLPGDKDEKLTAWMQPIFDNLGYLLSTKGSHLQAAESHSTEQRVQKLIADGRLVLEPLTYIRGRSIPHQFIIIDEAQNLSPHEVKTIVSRVGEGTKIILTGDIEQIDNPYLDASSNGLTYAVERLKGSPLCGHITLSKSERSTLASLATEKL
ncbi:MAG: PhoH family protein [Phycisphaerales bacterium]|nr:PhoH family protein [Phycisphaerales bacterium]